MSNEVAQREESSLEVFPPAQAPSSVARAMLHEHARMYADASKLAGALVKTTMVPKRFFGAQKQGDATAAILYGAELGLNPIQSLQRVVPIHGMPSLEARTMVGLLKARGYKVRTVEQSDTSVTVEGVALDGETASSTWTIERAIQAGYVPIPSSADSLKRPDVKEDWVTTSKTWDGKTTVSIVGNMKYITDPQTMLKAKAQAEVCRELAPDVLMGISYTREELESEDQRQFDRDERTAPVRSSAAPVTEDEILAEEVPIPDPEPAAPQQEPVEADQNPPEPTGEPAATSNPEPEPEPEQVQEPAQTAPAKRSTAPAANPGKPKTRMRQALEKRHFALIGDAGLSSDKDKDGRLAVYRSILDRPDITSADDLDDTELTQVSDQLYRWQTDKILDDEIAGILADAAREAEETSATPAAEPIEESE